MTRKRNQAFTLIELLTVIAIVGVLASLVVGLSTVASTKMREGRVRTELREFETAIERYKTDIGFYPPDNRLWGTNRLHYVTNALFYELSGTYLDRSRRFQLRGMNDAPLTAGQINQHFRLQGFANSDFEQNRHKVPNYISTISERDSRLILETPPIRLLSVPIDWPSNLEAWAPVPGTRINPWRYDSSSTNRHNRTGFDLWAELPSRDGIKIIGTWGVEEILLP